jgi:hypothetical protein
MIQVARARKPDAPLRTSIVVNPLNAVMYPAELTERGQHHRRRLMLSIVLFVGSVLLYGALGVTLRI